MIDYTNWPVIDTMDFSHVEFDITHWEDDTYTLMLNFYSDLAEKEGDTNSGLTICLQLASESLEEMHVKINGLIALGLFDQLDILGIGTIWNADGDQIGEVNWNDYNDHLPEEDEDENGVSKSSSEEKPKDPLHHRPVKTLQ